jgi:Saccharopine dehydrogenase NADP binding domain
MATTSLLASYSPIEEHSKKVPTVSVATFLLTSAFIPVWVATVLPLSVAYQIGTAVVRPLKKRIAASLHPPSAAATTGTARLDSGYAVPPDTIIARPKRKYDVVVLGATGFTGYLAARHLAGTYGTGTVKWAIAGRSQAKLDAVKARLASELQNPDLLTTLDTILVDTATPSTLPILVRNTRVVATTAGPYALYGNSVVEFCAKFGTHYVDITGEVDWVKAVLCQWQATAQATGAKLIPFCGHGAFVCVCLCVACNLVHAVTVSLLLTRLSAVINHQTRFHGTSLR